MLIFKTSAKSLLNATKLWLVDSEEVLSKERFGYYSPGYEKFKDCEQVDISIDFKDSIGKATAIFDSSEWDENNYNYIFFSNDRSEFLAFYKLEVPINLKKYDITKISVNIVLSMKEVSISTLTVSCDYSTHISRIANVHKELLNTEYGRKSDLTSIEQEPNFTTADLATLHENPNSLLRYSGSYFRGGEDSNDMNIGTYLEPFMVENINLDKKPSNCSISRGTSVVNILFSVDTTIHIGTAVDVDGYLSYKEVKETNIGSKILGCCGSFFWTQNELYNVNFSDGSFNSISLRNLRVISDDLNGTVYLVSKDGRYISDELKRKLEKSNRSFNITNLKGVSDLYSYFVAESSGNISCLGIKCDLRFPIKKIIPIRQRVFITLYANGYADFTEIIKGENSYEAKRSQLGIKLSNNKTYFKYIEKVARNRSSNPRSIDPDELLTSFEGQLIQYDSSNKRLIAV